MNKWFTLSRANVLRVLLIVLVFSIWVMGSGPTCNLFIKDSGSSVPEPVQEFLAYLYELVTDTGWWQALSANYQAEGGLQPIATTTASSSNYQND